MHESAETGRQQLILTRQTFDSPAINLQDRLRCSKQKITEKKLSDIRALYLQVIPWNDRALD